MPALGLLMSFVLTTWLLAMLPGVGQAMMMRQTLQRGPAAATMSNLGTVAGLVVWSAAAAAGLSGVLLARPEALTAIQLAGGALLVGLGLQGMVTVARGRSHVAATPDAVVGARRGRDFAAGLLVNLGNPKAGVFAVSLLPQFVPAGAPVGAAMLALGLLWAAVTGAWYVLFVRLVARGRDLLSRPRAQAWLTGTSNVVLVGVGVGVALGH